MSRKVLSVLLVSILFLFSSCGMPSYHDYSSSISISRAPTIVNGKSYDAGFSVRVSSSDPSVTSLSSETPSILIMYCIASGRGSFSSQFNSYIRNSNNYYNGTAASFNKSGQLNNVETTVDSHEVHLYHFTGEANRPLHVPAGYTYPSLKLDTTYYFMFEKVDNQDNTICLHLTVLESGSSDLTERDSFNVYRYDGSSFSRTAESGSGPDYEFYTDGGDSQFYELQLVAAVNLVPSASSSSNNIYWSALSFDSIEIN